MYVNVVLIRGYNTFVLLWNTQAEPIQHLTLMYIYDPCIK